MTKNEMLTMIENMNNYDELAAKAKEKADTIRNALKEEMVRLETEELSWHLHHPLHQHRQQPLRQHHLQASVR